MDKEYFGQETFFEGKAPLPEWAGYLIVIGCVEIKCRGASPPTAQS